MLAFSDNIDWNKLQQSLRPFYSHLDRAAKSIRLMCGLLVLRQMHNLSDERMVDQWQMNPYFQAFCGEKNFQVTIPCHSTSLVKFRQRIGEEGVKHLLAASVALHGMAAEETTAIVDIHCTGKSYHLSDRQQAENKGH